MAGVFEHHDKTRFETIAISLASSTANERRRRLARAFDRFVEAGDKDDLATARLLREMEIDIAVDLMGYTGECRPRILAFRPAPDPGQLSRLSRHDGRGAASTTSSPMRPSFPTSIAATTARRSSTCRTRICRPTTNGRSPSARRPERRRACRTTASCSARSTTATSSRPRCSTSGCACSKRSRTACSGCRRRTTPPCAIFAAKREARGVDASRLIFAPFVASADEHLARLTLADLFLDTLPYNAHSTASDALWAGASGAHHTGRDICRTRRREPAQSAGLAGADRGHRSRRIRAAWH